MRLYNQRKVYHRRLIQSGKVLEIYEYEKSVLKGCSTKRKGRASACMTSKEQKIENRKKTATRARKTVRTYVNANPHLKKFLTLTFAKNVTDLNYANKEFDKFCKRVKYSYEDFQYIKVVEFQERGAIHFHVLCNLPYVDVNRLAENWGHGFIKLNKIDNIDDVGAYVTKYMTKESVDKRLSERKCYSMSKGLNKPKEYTSEACIDEILENIDMVKSVYTSEYESEHYGKVRYTKLVCETPPNKPDTFMLWFKRYKARLTLMPDDTPCPFGI